MLWNIRHPYQCLIPIDNRDISTIVQLPLAFVRSGYVRLDAGRSDFAGYVSYDWSRVSHSVTAAYFLDVNPSDTFPSGGGVYGRWAGFPLQHFIIVRLPLAFVRSGLMDLSSGQMRVIGDCSFSWSHISQTYFYAYNLGMTISEVYPSNDNDERWYGFPLRCLYNGNV